MDAVRPSVNSSELFIFWINPMTFPRSNLDLQRWVYLDAELVRWVDTNHNFEQVLHSIDNTLAEEARVCGVCRVTENMEQCWAMAGRQTSKSSLLKTV